MNAPAAATGRIVWIDAARGAAILAMAIYHGAWDLGFLQLIVTDVGADPAWQAFARAIAGSFLVLAGGSLVLAHGDGVRWGAFLRRLAAVGVAALAVTAATWAATPDRYVFFGILHCIAVSSVLALPFLRAPVIAVLAAAMLVLAAPALFRSQAFDAPLLAWLGLAERIPATNDYVPLAPWFGFVLVGVAAARLAPPWLLRQDAFRQPKHPTTGALAAAGRHSLLVYLVHQPVLLAVLYPLSLALGPNPAAEAAPFLRSCETNCRDAGHGPAACPRVCACAADAFKARGLWEKVLQDRLSADEAGEASAIARGCFAADRTGQP